MISTVSRIWPKITHMVFFMETFLPAEATPASVVASYLNSTSVVNEMATVLVAFVYSQDSYSAMLTHQHILMSAPDLAVSYWCVLFDFAP